MTPPLLDLSSFPSLSFRDSGGRKVLSFDGFFQNDRAEKLPQPTGDAMKEQQLMNNRNPKVDGYLKRAKQWQEETEKLRAIALASPLTEEMKWGKPCYALGKKNIVLIQGFKEYCALLFFKGALLKDPDGLLFKPGENTQSGRQLRFTNVREIVQMKPLVKAYIDEAIAVEKSGLKVKLKKTTDFALPEELQNKFDELPALKAAFESLTPGRQRAYLLHFSAPKQSKTRTSRIEKCVRQILSGKGLND
jgi:uncharacterized protein YdeI (YjbR/CyaY-like superfamily)